MISVYQTYVVYVQANETAKYYRVEDNNYTRSNQNVAVSVKKPVTNRLGIS